VLRYSRLEPEPRRNPQVAEDYQRWFLARLRAVDAALADGDWLCAGRFTAADISVGYALLLAQTLKISEWFTEPVKVYWERLQARDGFQRAKAAQVKAAAEQGVAGELRV
jgi:glutathione S-transferase